MALTVARRAASCQANTCSPTHAQLCFFFGPFVQGPRFFSWKQPFTLGFECLIARSSVRSLVRACSSFPASPPSFTMKKVMCCLAGSLKMAHGACLVGRLNLANLLNKLGAEKCSKRLAWMWCRLTSSMWLVASSVVTLILVATRLNRQAASSPASREVWSVLSTESLRSFDGSLQPMRTLCYPWPIQLICLENKK